MYDLTVDKLAQFGLHRYEVSNFARSIPTQCKHNKGYWNGHDYIGLGPGAHSRFRPLNLNERSQEIAAYTMRGKKPKFPLIKHNIRNARVQTLEPEAWMREVEVVGHGTRKIDYLSSEDVMSELLATSLRTEIGLTEKIWLQKLREICDSKEDMKDNATELTLRSIIETDHKCDRFLENETLILDGENNLRLSKNGLKYLDHVLPYLISSLYKCMNNLSLQTNGATKIA